MTMRQIQIALERIRRRTQGRRRFEAQIHGVELKIPDSENDEASAELTPEQERLIEKDLAGLMRQKRR